MEALKLLKTGKSPGPDGLIVSYYKSFHKILTPHFTSAFINLTSSPHTFKDAHITLIPKPGKDETMDSNYRPISLLNVDLKLYAKILVNRLLPLLPKIITLDQVGFVLAREARDNTLKAINVHHWLSTSSTKGFFLSLDAETAFDRVAWDYMAATLQALGFPAHFLQFILSMYSSPTARIRVNGHLSSTFSILNGTHQGCPLSPLIFVLTLEPLLRRLRENPNISGITIRNRQYKPAAYADNILFLSDPLITLPNLLHDFTLFHKISNLQINFTKSKALNISLPSTLVNHCKANFLFSWEP